MKKYFSILLVFTIILTTPILSQSLSLWPDTGQTTSYTETFGEDSDYTRNPQSYTKLASGGVDLPDTVTSSNGWIMVKDNVTGLIWEIKTVDGSIHDKDNEYTWCANRGDSRICDGTDTQTFIDTLNNSSFGGFSDWRVPTIKELLTIVNNDNIGPSIDTNFFPNTKSSFYWSSTTFTSLTGFAWSVYFSDGSNGYLYKSFAYYVRAVRAGQAGSLDHLVDNGDGTVTDTSTELMWQQDTQQKGMTWEEAITYCESLSLAGYDDWRLPDKNELLSLVDYSKYGPAIDTNFFPNTQPSYNNYWSSTTDANKPGSAWNEYSYSGSCTSYDKSDTYHVRAVRAGQSGSLGHSITIESDLSFTLPDVLYQSRTGEVNLWVDFKFFEDQGGKLLWKLADYGTTTPTGNPITIAPDLSFNFDATYDFLLLEVYFKFFGKQDNKLLWELDSYTVE